MANCRNCLVQIVWVDRSDGNGRMPCEYIDVPEKKEMGLWVLAPGSLRVADPQPPLVKRHYCKPDEPFNYGDED